MTGELCQGQVWSWCGNSCSFCPPGSAARRLELEIPEFQIDELFDMPGVGCVAGGLVTQGIIVENMPLKVGLGAFG